MINQNTYSLVKTTIELGEKMVQKNFDKSEFENFQTQCYKTTQQLLKEENDDIIVHTCRILNESKLEDFRFNFFQKLFFPLWMKNLELWPNNKEHDLMKRYIQHANSYLYIFVKQQLR